MCGCGATLEGDAVFYDASQQTIYNHGRLLYELLSSHYNVTFVGHLYNWLSRDSSISTECIISITCYRAYNFTFSSSAASLVSFVFFLGLCCQYSVWLHALQQMLTKVFSLLNFILRTQDSFSQYRQPAWLSRSLVNILTSTCPIHIWLVNQARPFLTLRKVRKGLADVTSMHEMLTNQIILFHSETVAILWLEYVRLALVQL